MDRRLLIGGFVLVASAACGGGSQKTADKPADAKSAASQPANAAAGAASGGAAAGQAGASAQTGAQQAAQGLSALAQGLQQMSKNTAKPVDFEELKALLPDIAGWTKSDVHGEQVSMGISQSNARAKYTKGESTVELEITDSTMNQLILAPITMFLAAGYEEKSDDGYKKAMQIAGYPGFEEWEKGSKHAESTAVIGNRFIVTAKAHEVENADVARKAIEAVNLAKLAGIK